MGRNFGLFSSYGSSPLPSRQFLGAVRSVVYETSLPSNCDKVESHEFSVAPSEHAIW
jgi:hypothetical protein